MSVVGIVSRHLPLVCAVVVAWQNAQELMGERHLSFAFLQWSTKVSLLHAVSLVGAAALLLPSLFILSHYTARFTGHAQEHARLKKESARLQEEFRLWTNRIRTLGRMVAGLRVPVRMDSCIQSRIFGLPRQRLVDDDAAAQPSFDPSHTATLDDIDALLMKPRLSTTNNVRQNFNTNDDGDVFWWLFLTSLKVLRLASLIASNVFAYALFLIALQNMAMLVTTVIPLHCFIWTFELPLHAIIIAVCLFSVLPLILAARFFLMPYDETYRRQIHSLSTSCAALTHNIQMAQNAFNETRQLVDHVRVPLPLGWCLRSQVFNEPLPWFDLDNSTQLPSQSEGNVLKPLDSQEMNQNQPLLSPLERKVIQAVDGFVRFFLP